MSELKFTPTQQALMAVLNDGLPHTKAELRACLSDELATLNTLRFHLSTLRNKLRPIGRDILCEATGQRGANATLYRQVQLLCSNND